MDKGDRIVVTGARGFVGKNLATYLRSLGHFDVAEANSSLDYLDAAYEQLSGADYVFHCAGRVRGIAGNMANQEAAYRQNVLINTNVVTACIEYKVKKIVALGTVAMYSDRGRSLTGDHFEDMMECGLPHEAEFGYAMAKRGMLAHLRVSGLNWAMPICTNMYGAWDRFDIKHGHCIPSLVRKFYERDVTVWGDGTQERDFLYIKDAVRALHRIMERGDGVINMASGQTLPLNVAISCLSHYADFRDVKYDTTKPIGQKTRSYDISRLEALGFRTEYNLDRGLRETYDWYAEHHDIARKGDSIPILSKIAV